MSRAVLLARRAGTQRALLALVGALVAVLAAMLVATLAVVRSGAAAVPAARTAVVAGAGVPVALLVVAALVTVAQVGRLLGQERRAETELLLSRGAGPAQVSAFAVAEAAVVCLIGAGAGTVVAAAVLRGAGRPAEPWLLVVVGACVALVAAILLSATTAIGVHAAARRSLADRSGRARQVATGGVVVLTVLVALVALVQLRRYGSPLVVAADGGTRTDPLAASAPALVLASLVVVAVAVLGPLARLAERVVARHPGLAVVTVRQAGRRLVASAVPLVLVVLAAGSAAFAGVYAGTAQRMAGDVGVLAAGADVRVTRSGVTPAQGLTGADADVVAAVTGVDAAVPVLRLETSVQHVKPTVLAVPAAAAAGVVRTTRASDAATVDGVLRGGADPFPGAPTLPDGTTALEVGVTASVALAGTAYGTPTVGGADEPPGFPAATLWLARADGALAGFPLGAFTEGGPGPTSSTIRLELPRPAHGWRLVALDLDVVGAREALQLRFAVDGVAALVQDHREPVDLTASWTTVLGDTGAGTGAGASAGSGTGAGEAAGLGADLLVTGRSRHRLRVAPAALGTAPVAAVVTTSLATDLGVRTGDRLELGALGVRVPIVVGGTVEAMPGALRPAVAMADLAHLNAALLRSRMQLPAPAEVWADVAEVRAGAWSASDDAAARRVAAAVEEALPGTTVVTPATAAPGADASGPVRAATWIAAAGVVALAVLGVGVTADAGLRARRGEVVALRSIGVGPRVQGRSRAVELGVVVVGGAVLGVVGGWALGAGVAPGLVLSTVTGVDQVPPAVLAWAAAPAGALTGALVVGVVGVAVAAGARVRAQVRDTTYREEVR